ncbi:MAG: DUF5677 domain-containing protein [Candidatus Gracilibacteria bacterium]
MNKTNIEEFDFSKDKIKNKYKKIRSKIKLAISSKYKLDERYYSLFKNRVKVDFPDFFRLISEIESTLNINKTRKYLIDKEKEIRKSGKSNKDINLFFLTKILEVCVKKKTFFLSPDSIQKTVKIVEKNVLSKFSKKIIKKLMRVSMRMLPLQKICRGKFENALYIRWKDPLDLLECLIEFSIVAGEEHKNKLTKTLDRNNDYYKKNVLIKIHARALQISNEIFVLLKSGYADGANARWRSLHELAVIAFFLKQNNDEVSKRYLEHEAIKRFKEAKDYKKIYEKFGYLPFDRKEFNKIEKEHDDLIGKYGKEFEYMNGFEWIPKIILSNRNFRELEEYVNFSDFRVFYNLSCNAVHGGARGFYRLGLMNKHQNSLHLVGSSNYGLADPIGNTALSLFYINYCLFVMEPDFMSIIQMQTMSSYVNELRPKVIKIQKQIEKEDFLLNSVHKAKLIRKPR